MAMREKMQAQYLQGYGFTAPTIIDVGVLEGSPFLYDAFPDRKFVLIDPLEESRDAVAGLWGRLDYTFHVVALGACEGTLDLAVNPRRLSRTSGTRRLRKGRAGEARRVDVVRLDTIAEGLTGPLGLKIDTEGQELEVLKGATRTLPRCEFVIAEVSIKKRFAGGYRFSDVISFMASQGFEVHSFLSGLTRAPRMADVLFLPADSPRFDMTTRDRTE